MARPVRMPATSPDGRTKLTKLKGKGNPGIIGFEQNAESHFCMYVKLCKCTTMRQFGNAYCVMRFLSFFARKTFQFRIWNGRAV